MPGNELRGIVRAARDKPVLCFSSQNTIVTGVEMCYAGLWKKPALGHVVLFCIPHQRSARRIAN
jgi:hypothetical protein